jgi:adenine-specific DNA-methyltransferase
LDLRESASDEAHPNELLTEILLKQGYSLTEEINEIKVGGLNLKTIGDNLVIAYLEENPKLKLEQLREVLDKRPVKFIILEDCFEGDDELKTNLAQECKSRNIELWTA